MLYILYDSKTYNYTPEIDYGNGFTLSFKKGLFLFDENKNKTRNSYYSDYYGRVIISDEYYDTKKNLIFNNPIKAEIVFLQMKIDEMKKCSFDFFMPISYKKLVDRYHELKEKYPEYVL